MKEKTTSQKIKQALKKELPNFKIRVTCDKYAGGSSIDILLLEGDINPFNELNTNKYAGNGGEVNNYHFETQIEIWNEDGIKLIKKIFDIAHSFKNFVGINGVGRYLNDGDHFNDIQANVCSTTYLDLIFGSGRHKNDFKIIKNK